MAKAEVLWDHNVIGRYYLGSRDIGPSMFNKHFGRSVPACTCQHRTGLEPDLPVPPKPQAGGFLLHDGPADSAVTWRKLQSRLQVMLVRTTGNIDFAFQELGDPRTQTPGIEHHAGSNAKQVLRALRKFESQGWHKRHS